MGFIKAFSGAVSGTFADQWKDFLIPRSDVPATAGLFEAVSNGTNNGRGENYKGNANIISNGSKIVVPEGTALITVQDGKITGVVTEPGGFEFRSDDPNSQSVFAGNLPLGSMWNKMTFGGQPGSQQLAFYVNMKEIPGLKIGTAAPVPYDDAFLETQVSVVARGSYSLKIVDPVTFFRVVPDKYKVPGAPVCDFADFDNDLGTRIHDEISKSLRGAFTAYSNDPEHGGRLQSIIKNQVAFALTLNNEVETNYQWKSSLGIEIVRAALDLEYDEKTQALLDSVREDDVEIRRAKRMGAAYSNNMPGMMAAASGQAMQNAAANENGAMMGFMGMNMAQTQGANMLNTVNQMNTQPAPVQPVESNTNVTNDSTVAASEDPMAKLASAKKMLDAGLITEADYNNLKSKLLGL